ncbi:hypothetical protein MMC20_003908 [Loxospora ochrophaea]|nr:hypothetical protein [Loxospora ochrophaea]
MASYLRTGAIAALLTTTLVQAQSSGSGTTTRYWDCCKPSCAWNTVTGITAPVQSCDINDSPMTDTTAQSGCTGGSAYMCSDQSPWAVSDTMAYGFAAVTSANPTCCQCYKLTFTSTAISGMTMIVQATNTGTDVGSNQFDLAMPGGGFGIYDGCTTEWDAASSIWGAQYGGPSTNTCSSFPSKLQAGCNFRWDWMQGADNPTVDWEMVSCPAEIVAKSGCATTSDTPTGPSSASSSAAGSATSAPASSASSVAPVSSAAPVSSSAPASSAAPASSSAAVSSAAPVSSTAPESSAAPASSSAPESSAAPVSSTTPESSAAPVSSAAPIESSSAAAESTAAPVSASSSEGAHPAPSSTVASEPTAPVSSAPEPTETGDDDTCEL